MNISSLMTTIVLEKDVEDKELYNEIIKIRAKLSREFSSEKNFLEEYPMINNLRQLLHSELFNNQDGDY